MTIQSASANAYLDRIAKRVTRRQEAKREKGHYRGGCPGYYLIGECSGSEKHQFGKEVFCQREWCPVCGAKGSAAHNRRIQRWLLKASEMEHIGYFVFTIPEGLRMLYRSQKALNRLSKLITCGDKSKKIKGFLKSKGFKRGLSRWHFYGDESPGVYAPHLNVLVEAGRLAEWKLKEIKAEWSRILGQDAVVHYQYKKSARKMASCVGYVTRATFLNIEWDENLASELYRFHNTKSWGKWGGERKWGMDNKKKRGLEIRNEEGKEVCVCPKCGGTIHWSSAQDMLFLQVREAADCAKYLGDGYWEFSDQGVKKEERKHESLYGRLLRGETISEGDR